MIRDYQAIEKTWFRKGEQRIFPAFGKHEEVKLIGILNNETGNVYCREEEKYHATVFLDSPKDVLYLYPTGNNSYDSRQY